MNYKVKGFITQIDEVKELDNGAKSLRYRINTEENYNNIWEFEMYKTVDYSSHVDNFVKYNKVGDRVEVEFSIRPREWEGKIYTSLSHWKIEKLTQEEDAIHSRQEEVKQSIENMNPDPDDNLPF